MKTAEEIFPFSDYVNGNVNYEEIIARMEEYASQFQSSTENVEALGVTDITPTDMPDYPSYLEGFISGYKEAAKGNNVAPLRWVKASEKPPETKHYYCNILSVNGERKFKGVVYFNAHDDRWHTDNKVVEWLDESPSNVASPQEYYVPVEIKEGCELPTKEGGVRAIAKDPNTLGLWYHLEKGIYNFKDSDGNFEFTHWLKKVSNQHPTASDDEWISVEDSLPYEGGRYWCYIKELNDLGWSYFQWNCYYDENERRFSDSTLTNGENVTHWRPLPEPPKVSNQSPDKEK